jgi:hypothetical protein
MRLYAPVCYASDKTEMLKKHIFYEDYNYMLLRQR